MLRYYFESFARRWSAPCPPAAPVVHSRAVRSKQTACRISAALASQRQYEPAPGLPAGSSLFLAPTIHAGADMPFAQLPHRAER